MSAWTYRFGRGTPRQNTHNLLARADVDSGKTTLSQRFLQDCGSVAVNSSGLFLDQLQVERERGITVHASTTSFLFTPADASKGTYLMNLVDTPGHVDFQYEVSRALKACEGAVLLVVRACKTDASIVRALWLFHSCARRTPPRACRPARSATSGWRLNR